MAAQVGVQVSWAGALTGMPAPSLVRWLFILIMRSLGAAWFACVAAVSAAAVANDTEPCSGRAKRETASDAAGIYSAPYCFRYSRELNVNAGRRRKRAERPGNPESPAAPASIAL
eukprot:scaffold56666_cov57-Phaeocystis_antarctica.AAC.4